MKTYRDKHKSAFEKKNIDLAVNGKIYYSFSLSN